MSVIFQPDDQQQTARLQQYAQADAYRAQAVSTNEIAALNSFSAAYPTADPSVIAGLVKQGLQPNDPAVQKIMMMHTQQQQHSGWFDKLGDVIGGAVSKVGEGLGFVAQDTASGIAGLGKGVVRAGLVALQTPMQELQDFERASIYTALSPVSGSPGAMNQSFGSALQNSGTSSGVEAISHLLHGEPVDLGSGFIPGGQIEKDVGQAATRLPLAFGQAKFGPGTQAITAGRVVGGTVFQQGSTPYNILSGLIDAGISWELDPAAALGSAAKEAEVGARLGRALPVALDEGLGAGIAELGVKPSLTAAVGHTSMGAGTRSLVENAMGMISGHRPTTIPSLSETALSKGGQRIIQHIADEPNAQTIYEASKRQIPIAVSNELAGTSTPQEVLSVLNSHVGNEITQFPQWNGVTVKAMGLPTTRLAGMMPGKIMDPNNLEDVYAQTDRLLQTMKTSPALKNQILQDVMATPDAQSVAPTFFKGIGQAADEMAPKLRTGLKQASGESDEVFASRVADAQQVKASGLVRSFAADGETMRAYLGDEITRNDMAAGLSVDGKLIPSQSPYQMLEFLNSAVPVPNARDIRTATATLGRLVDNPLFKSTTGLADTLMHYWKPLTIIKPALVVKLAGGHQGEMAAAGFDSFFSHPWSFVQSVLANPAKAQEFMDSAREAGPLRSAVQLATHPFQTVEALASKAASPVIGQIRQGDITGTPWINTAGENAMDDLMKGMSNDVSDLAGVAGGGMRGQRLYTMQDGPALYGRAWHNSLSEISHDPVWQKVAEGHGNLDSVKNWFSVGEGSALRDQLATRLPMLKTPAGADAYIDSLYRGLVYRTGGDPATIEAVSTGMFEGAPMGQLDDAGKYQVSDAFKQHLTGVVGPDTVKGSVLLTGANPQAARFDQAMTYMFDHLLQTPFEKLVTHPAFADAYWQDAEKMLPFMDGPTRDAMLENAAKEGVGPGAKVLKRMQETPPVANPTVISLDDANLILKKRALDATKKVLYDQTNKSQFFDAMRTVFPFGEAWRQAVNRWAKIAINNPNTVVGGQKIVTALQGNPNGGTDYGPVDPTNPNSPHRFSGTGFFHKDQNGNEVFNIPFGRNLSKVTLGLAVPLVTLGQHGSEGASTDLTSQASGLSALADILPGTGPLLQVGAGAILPNTPDWDWARNFISPRGPNDTSSGVVESSLPGFAKTVKQLFQAGSFNPNNPRDVLAQKTYASYVADASNSLTSTGRYDLTDPSGREMSKMLDDAQAIAKGMMVLHALGQAFSPSSPALVSLAKVKDGHQIEQGLLGNELAKAEQDPRLGPGVAVQQFLDKYGEQAFLATQGKTLSLVGQAPLGQASSDWARANASLVKDYPLAWSLFAPQDSPDSFDYSAYQRQLASGQRVPVDATQRIQLAQIHLAAHQYAIAQARLGPHPTARDRAWLGQVRQLLQQEYPAYGKDVPGLPAKYAPDTVIQQVARAVVDPRVSGSPVARATQTYLEARQKAITEAQSKTGSSAGPVTGQSASGRVLSGQGAEGIQAWLTNIGNLLIQETPAFGPFFNSVFARELT